MTVLVVGEVRRAVVAPVHHVEARLARPLSGRGMRGIVFSCSPVGSKPPGQKSPILLHTPLLARTCVERQHFPWPRTPANSVGGASSGGRASARAPRAGQGPRRWDRRGADGRLLGSRLRWLDRRPGLIP